MTRDLNIKNHGTPFGAWLREQPEIHSQRGTLASLDIENLDYVVFAYVPGKIMMVEEKSWADPDERRRNPPQYVKCPHCAASSRIENKQDIGSARQTLVTGTSPARTRVQRPSQIDTHGIIHQLLLRAHVSELHVATMRGVRRVRYYGYHVLELSNSTPSDSTWMRLDSKEIDRDGLLRFLSFKSPIQHYIALHPDFHYWFRQAWKKKHPEDATAYKQWRDDIESEAS